MKIVVLSGGYSEERNVSLSSGTLIANALIENGHEVMLLDLYLGKNSEDFIPEYTKCKKYEYSIPEFEPNLESLKKLTRSNVQIGEGVLELCQDADVVFMALHGSIGENGQIQSLFDIFNIKYTGTGYIGSLLAMNKDISKKLMKASNILTPNWFMVTKREQYDKSNISFPCVVKPCSNGSSIGISIVNNQAEYSSALNKAFKYEEEIVVEEMIKGREFSVGILENRALPVIEIIPRQGFYDYRNKYQKGLTCEVCPAKINEKLAIQIQERALEVHQLFHLNDYSRIDFIMNNDEKIYCLEANTLPGMTPTSLLPQEAYSAGINYNDLCEKICELALK